MIKGEFIDVDLQKNDLLITTASTLGSNHKSKFLIYDQDSDVNIAAFWINFEDEYLTYHVGKCSKGDTKFPDSPILDDVNKTWKISKIPGRLQVFCNGEKVLEYVFSDAAKEGCAKQWSLEAMRIKFSETEDTASLTYAIAPKQEIAGKEDVFIQIHFPYFLLIG